MITLGINNMHDASAAVVVDGKIVAAVEEERFTRKKNQIGFPVDSIRYCLKATGCGIRDVDAIGVSWKPWVIGTRVFNAFKTLPFSAKAFRAKAKRGVGQMGNEWRELFNMEKLIENRLGCRGKFRLYYHDHHLCHAVSAYSVSPFKNAAILTVDGAGEKNTTVFWKGCGDEIKKLKEIRLPHSIGQFYSAITGFLGFKPQADEYKVMGMSSYGVPEFVELFMDRIIQLCGNGGFKFHTDIIDYHLARQKIFSDDLIRLIGKNRLPGEPISQKHLNVAKSAQVVLEKTVFQMANKLYEIAESDKLCLAGGVAFNCVANGKLFSNTKFRSIFVQPASGDAGTAIGAALLCYNNEAGLSPSYEMCNVYLGPSFSNQICKEALNKKAIAFEELSDSQLCNAVAIELTKGKLVCWFQGRMEWGPRALGNRSLLADPRNGKIKDIINSKIKLRESFRPFAPSILQEHFKEYFDAPQLSPFMLFAYKVKEEMRKLIPAVVHVDGTARPQTVCKNENPIYWKLINQFYEYTNIPMLLNTSFNVQEPIVCTPQEAISCFFKTEADYLVLNNCLISR